MTNLRKFQIKHTKSFPEGKIRFLFDGTTFYRPHQKDGEGNVFSLFTPGGEVPLPPILGWDTPLARSGWEVPQIPPVLGWVPPILGGGTLTPTWIEQQKEYFLPLAFTQKDFLIWQCFLFFHYHPHRSVRGGNVFLFFLCPQRGYTRQYQGVPLWIGPGSTRPPPPPTGLGFDSLRCHAGGLLVFLGFQLDLSITQTIRLEFRFYLLLKHI